MLTLSSPTCRWWQMQGTVCGRSQWAAGQPSLVVNDSRISADTPACATLQTADASLLYIQYIALGGGTMTLNGNANATGTPFVSWIASGNNIPVIN